LLTEALKRGVTVIAAHCGTRSAMFETDYVDVFARMAKEHENLYGDTSALNLPTRSQAYNTILGDREVMAKVIHGSDWPVIPVPPLRLGLSTVSEMFHESNWLKNLVCAVGFHRWQTLKAGPSGSDFDFCRWCPEIRPYRH